MNGWFVLQLAVNLFFLFLIVFLIFRNSMKRAPEIEELHSLLKEIKASIKKNENLAKKIEQDLREAGNVIAVQETIRRKKATAAMKREGKWTGVEVEHGGAIGGVPSIAAVSVHKKRVATLHKQEVPREEISKRLSIPLAEVDLIIAMIGE